ncbi:hypothetical protein [Paenibacillus sp. R14(2021)]|uniref:hypothetical protein n=1 Tax=Paenibacillus sp. R14(2021) TaxID=2859228 RepID=UPI001C615B9B|nr:hypothetical protein [Paenibacillus sp. R14(2021)]
MWACTCSQGGFYSTYAIVDRVLQIDEMYIGLKDNGDAPPDLWDSAPVRHANAFWYYRSLKHRVNYSGKVVICRNFLGPAVRSGAYHPPHCFEVVLEQVFSDGVLVNLTSYNDLAADVRELMKQ